MKRFAFLVLFLVACTAAGGPQVTDVHTGTKGITAQMLDQQKTFAAGSPASVSLELKNEGASDVAEGYLSINTEEDVLSVEGDRIRRFDLQGKILGSPVGESDIMSIQLKAKSLPPQTAILTTNVGATICYPYQTQAAFTVCVDTDVLGRVKTKPCQALPLSSSGEGAPVLVARIEPTYSLADDHVSVAYQITVRNAGTGQVYDASKSFEACTPQALGADWNRAKVTAYLGDDQLACAPATDESSREASVSLAKDALVRCELLGGVSKTAGTYTTTLRVQVDYGYAFTLTKPFQIQRIG